MSAVYRRQETATMDPEYEFVTPSQEFYCPVTKGVLLDPHQTRCCGKILLEEVIVRTQIEGGTCPVCMKAPLMTYPDQNLYRKVREQQIFCPNKKRGCDWVGKLATVGFHEKSCPRKNSLLQIDMTQLFQTL